MFAKLQITKASISQSDVAEMVIFLELERYMQSLEKLIDLVERRLLKEQNLNQFQDWYALKLLYLI